MLESFRHKSLARRVRALEILEKASWTGAAVLALYGMLIHEGSEAIGLFLIIGAPCICSIIAQVAADVANRRRGELRSIQAHSQASNFFLLLRSFRSSPVRYGGMMYASGSTGLIATVDTRFLTMDDVLGEAVSPHPLVYLVGEKAELNVRREAAGAVPLRCLDKDWFTVASALLHDCRAVFLVPEDSPGLMEELALIRETGVLSKTIVLVPPAFQEDPLCRERAARWNELRASLSDSGWELPLYDELGCAYLADSGDGESGSRVWFTHVGTIFGFPDSLRRVLDTLLPRVPAGRPLAHCLRGLDGLVITPDA